MDAASQARVMRYQEIPSGGPRCVRPTTPPMTPESLSGATAHLTTEPKTSSEYRKDSQLTAEKDLSRPPHYDVEVNLRTASLCSNPIGGISQILKTLIFSLNID